MVTVHRCGGRDSMTSFTIYCSRFSTSVKLSFTTARSFEAFQTSSYWRLLDTYIFSTSSATLRVSQPTSQRNKILVDR